MTVKPNNDDSMAQEYVKALNEKPASPEDNNPNQVYQVNNIIKQGN